MTAALQHPPKSILQSPDHMSSLKRCRAGAKQSPVSVGKLRNIRNFYARRRPTMQPQIPRVVSPLPERHSRVRFCDDDSVHSILSRKDYSEEEKQQIWLPRSELRQLIQKNHTEFAYEGRDWRNAPEEDKFATDDNGEPIHPAHVARKIACRVQVVVSQKRRPRLWRRKLPMSQCTEDEYEHEQQCKSFCRDNSDEMDL